jgi:Ca2+:H+ antiporter
LEGAVITRKINILLVAIPLVLFSDQIQTFIQTSTGLTISDGIRYGITFALAALALIPLAGFVESAVEELAELLGPFVGGLLHTTFGNVAELTIGLAVLLSFVKSGGAVIVEGSIAGVIIRNSLLFLGLSTLLGCFRNGHMKFDAENASEYSTVFALAVVGLSIPTIVRFLPLEAGTVGGTLVLPGNIPLPGFLAVVLVVSYLAYIGFAVFRLGEGYNLVEIRRQKRLQRQKLRQAKKRSFQQRLEALEQPFPIAAQPDTLALFAEERLSAEQRLHEEQSHVASPDRGNGRRIYAKAGLIEEKRRKRAEKGDGGILAGRPVQRGLVALLVLAVATAGVAAMSEGFAHSTEELIKLNGALKDYDVFLGLILIPILAGVVELYGSVGAARENRMEITMAVTAGASIQMILLVVPVLVLVGLFTGHPLDLVFNPIEVIIFGASTFIFMLLSRDGESTWLEGVQLCSFWALVAVAAIFIHG